MKTRSLALAGRVAFGASSASALTSLVVNGDFEAGNTGFSSDYAFAFPNSSEGQYFVGTNAQAWNGNLIENTDHTPGDGGPKFLGNGSSAGVPVWLSSDAIPVSSDTDYFFEAWLMNLCYRPGTLGNGVDPVGASGSATSVILMLVNSNTVYAGNDFAIDDIFLDTETSIAPEPTTTMLLLAGLGGLAARRTTAPSRATASHARKPGRALARPSCRCTRTPLVGRSSLPARTRPA
jgi:hypothetical protein